MVDASGVTNQALFLSKLENSVDDVYSVEDVFTLMSIEVKAQDGIISPKQAFGLLSKNIKKAIVNKNDCYSFWGNTFYILTYMDNKQVIGDFINSLALTVNKKYAEAFYLDVAYLQYPYDIRNIKNIFADLKKIRVKIIPEQSDFDSWLVTDRDYNSVVSKELTKYLKSIKLYSEVLYGHCLFVAKVSVHIAKALNFPTSAIKKIVIAAILHDIGYLSIPQKIIANPQYHNAKNIALLKMHPLLATRKILAEKGMLKEILPLIEQHHEYIDGTGYPFGLSYEGLSMEAQIISIADTYDLLRSQKNISEFEIINFFVARAGIRWDEKPITVFVAILMDTKHLENILNTSKSFADFF